MIKWTLSVRWLCGLVYFFFFFSLWFQLHFAISWRAFSLQLLHEGPKQVNFPSNSTAGYCEENGYIHIARI